MESRPGSSVGRIKFDRLGPPPSELSARAVLHANLVALDQTAGLLERVTPAEYRQPVAGVFNTSIGAHVRHSIDHHLQFLHGLDNGRIDYDARNREPDVETILACGLSSVRRAAQGLAAVDQRHEILWIRVDNDAGESAWQISSFGRELAFLLSHTVHHQALIAVICRHLPSI